jgi:DNA-binding MarR family transcriptional regulator
MTIRVRNRCTIPPCHYLYIKIPSIKLYIKLYFSSGFGYELTMQQNAADMIDKLVEDWNRERPESRPEPMAIIGRIMRLGRGYLDEVYPMLQPLGISYSDFDVLATLRRNGAPYSLTPTELAKNVLLSSGAMTACLTRLEDAGLIDRVDHESDRRSRSALLSTKGVELVDSLIDQRFELARRQLDPLNATEKKTLEALLRRLELP